MSHLKDVPVVLYEVSDGAASNGVLPVCLEQRGAEHYGQVTEVHLVVLRITLHAETCQGDTRRREEAVLRDTTQVHRAFLTSRGG